MIGGKFTKGPTGPEIREWFMQGMTKEQLADAQKFMVDLWQHIDDYMLATAAYDGVLCMGTGTQADQNAERDWFVQRRKLRDFIGLSPETVVPLYPGADMTRQCDNDGLPIPYAKL